MSLAAKAAGIFAVLATLWIVGSDQLVDWVFQNDPTGMQTAQTFKGLFFVSMMTAVLFYTLRRLHRMEHQFQQMEAMLAVSEKLEVVGSFAATIAHDLNNMLMVVRGLTELAKMDQACGVPTTPKRLNEIESAVVRANGLVRQLSTFLRGTDDAVCEIDPELTLRSFEPLLRQAATKQVEFRCVLGVDLPAVAIAPVALEQALLNLVVNARDAMEGRTDSRLTVEAERCELRRFVSVFCGRPRSGSFLRISVQDNGCGIPPDMTVRVFEPFFTTKPDGKGTGLGLASVVRTMQQNGGWVELRSEVGEGSLFHLYLPEVKAARHAVEAA